MILKPGLIPIQDDPENVRRRGVPRPDADTHAERRGTHPGTDASVPPRQSRDPIQRPEPSRAVRVCAALVGGSGVRQATQEAARSDSSVPEQGHRTELAADHPLDPPMAPEWGGEGPAVAAPTVYDPR